MVTASSRNHSYLQILRAGELIDYTQTEFANAVHAAHPEGIDAVLGCIGGETAARSLKVVRDGGRIFTIVDLEQRKGERILWQTINHHHIVMQLL
ncbi:MAG TPA: zinc-binding dehydrogenase [Ktedonobacteraceae bacterium]|nr:zinc-binding dehydrogenase [Ktedonobacteraceae bacterium]